MASVSNKEEHITNGMQALTMIIGNEKLTMWSRLSFIKNRIINNPPLYI